WRASMAFWGKPPDEGRQSAARRRNRRDFCTEFRITSSTMTRRATMWIKGVGVAIGLTFALATGLAIPVTTCAQAQVKLVVGGRMPGGGHEFAEEKKRGVGEEEKGIKGAGGILAQKFERGDGGHGEDPKEELVPANKFAADGVKFVNGYFNAGVTIPASDVY